MHLPEGLVNNSCYNKYKHFIVNEKVVWHIEMRADCHLYIKRIYYKKIIYSRDLNVWFVCLLTFVLFLYWFRLGPLKVLDMDYVKCLTYFDYLYKPYFYVFLNFGVLLILWSELKSNCVSLKLLVWVAHRYTDTLYYT